MVKHDFRTKRLIALFLSLVAIGGSGVAGEPDQPEIMDPADAASDVCPTEWAALADAAPDYVAAFTVTRVDPSFGAEGAVAAQRAQLLGHVMGANTGAFVSWMSIAHPSISDEHWRAEELEHDLQNEWIKGRANFRLLDCLLPVTLSERTVLESWLRAAAPPDVPQAAITAELDHWFTGLEEFSSCHLDARRIFFEAEYGQDAITTTFMDTVHPMLSDCQD